MTTPNASTKRSPRFFAKVEDGVGSLLIYDEIGGYWGITPKSVVDAIESLKAEGAKALHVFLNTPGGDVFDGNAIFNAIRRFAGEKVIHIDGLAASMGSVIAMAGDRIKIAPNAMVMVHEPWGMAVGDAAAIRERADLLETLSENILGTYQRRTKQSAEDLKRWMADETWMTAQEALARGFADEITDSEAAEQDSEEADVAARWPTLSKFRRAPANAARLLARACAIRPAATSRSTPARPANQKEETVQNPVANPSPASASVTLTEEQLRALVARASEDGANRAISASVIDPTAQVIADATEHGARRPEARGEPAFRVGRYQTPRAAKGREKRSDDQVASRDHGNSVLRGMPMARAFVSLVRAKEIGEGCSLPEAAEMLGFLGTAEQIAKGQAMVEGDATLGGPFVTSDIQAGFIDSLEHQVVMRRLIPAGNIMKSARETIQFTKLGGGMNGAWVGETPGAGDPGGVSTGVLTLRARKQRIEALLSRDQIRDASSNVDQIAYARLALRSGQMEDLAIVEGKGTEGEPKGLRYWAANNIAATATPDFEKARKDLRGMLKKLATLKVPGELGRAFVGAESHKWGLGDFVDVAGAHPFERELDGGRLCNQPAAFSTQFDTTRFHCFAPGASILFDQLAMLLETDNTYIDPTGKTVSASASDEVVIRLWRRMDFGMQYGEAVVDLTAVPWGS